LGKGTRGGRRKKEEIRFVDGELSVGALTLDNFRLRRRTR